MIDWILKQLGRERFDIGPVEDLYLTRWTLFGKRFSSNRPKLFLHRFYRSDRPVMHDHPWPFVSLILTCGYWEHTMSSDGSDKKIWYGPGRILSRPANWKHWVEIPKGKTALTVVLAGVKEKSWGYWPKPDCCIPHRDFESGVTSCE